VPDGLISIDDPRADDVRALLERHLAFAKANTPPEDVHALEVDALLDPAVTFFSFRVDGELLGVAALKRLDEEHAEIKSMHTSEAARGRGIGRALVDHLIGVARERGHRRVSLETGSGPAFAAARHLYASARFTPCGPFADYPQSPNSAHMTLDLGESYPSVAQLLEEARGEIGQRLSPLEADAAARAGAALIDIRAESQRERDGTLPDATYIARNVLEWRLDPASPHRDPDHARRDRRLILICDEGYQSSLAAATLKRFGLDATDVIGGFQAWRAAGLPVED
jgi:putative acetyltransferase